MSVTWHHPAKQHADSAVRAASGMASARHATEQRARAPVPRTVQSTGLRYTPSSPRHAPPAAAHALRAGQASSSAHESRSTMASQTSAQQSAHGPEEIARRALQRKLSNLGRADSGALSTPESGAVSERSKANASKRKRPREPQAAPAPVDDHPTGGARHATPPTVHTQEEQSLLRSEPAGTLPTRQWRSA